MAEVLGMVKKRRPATPDAGRPKGLTGAALMAELTKWGIGRTRDQVDLGTAA